MRSHEQADAMAAQEQEIRVAMAAGTAVNREYQQQAGQRFGPAAPGGAQGSGPGDVLAGDPGTPSGPEADRIFKGKRS